MQLAIADRVLEPEVMAALRSNSSSGEGARDTVVRRSPGANSSVTDSHNLADYFLHYLTSTMLK
jgi:hypothetical protein